MTGAFSHLNLRYNPFGELEPRARAAVAVVDTAALVERLRTPGTAVQLLGDCGRGKTTHLLALARALPEARYLRLLQDQPPPPAEPAAILLLDEADAVWSWRRLALLRAAHSVALAVHRSLALELRALGFSVHTVRVGGLDADRLAAIVRERVEAARLAPGPVPTVPTPTLLDLLSRHGDDVRAIEGELYEAFQSLDEVRHVAL